MRKRSKPSLQRSLLSYAIAAAAVGLMPGAHAVDLCAGNATTTISTDVSGDTCTLDTAGATLTITASGAIDDQISVNVGDAVVSNAGSISDAASAGGWTSVYGIYAGNLGAGASVSNSGTVTVSGISTTSQVSANGIRVGNLSDGATVSNSGTVSATADGEDWAGAYGVGSWESLIDNGSILNDSTGVIEALASATSAYYASAYGMFAPYLDNNSVLSNAGTITASASGTGSADASAYGIYQYWGVTDSTISNSGTLNASATATDAWAGAWGFLLSDGASGTSSISNSGTLTVAAAGWTASATGIRVNDTLGGSATLANSGTITATAEADSRAQARGLSADIMSGAASMTNSGTITATATSLSSSASAWGMQSASISGGSVTNSGSIAATATATGQWAGAYGIGGWSVGTLDGVSISNEASGTISALATGDRGSAYGIVRQGDMTNGSSIANAGTITATVYSGNGSSAQANGINVWTMVDSSVSNAGLITAEAAGGNQWVGAWGLRAAALQGDSSISNTGVINVSVDSGSNGSVYGIQASSLSGQSVISNSGAISVSGSGATWMSAFGIRTEQLLDAATLTNSGTISVTSGSVSDSASAYGILFTNVGVDTSVSNSGSITATVTATADGQWAGAYGMGSWAWQAPNEFQLDNSGSIAATAHGDRGSAYGIYLSGWGSYDLAMGNSGTITASTTAGEGSHASAYGLLYEGSSYSNHFYNSGSITATASGTGSDTWAGAFGMNIIGDLFEDMVLQTGSEISNAGAIAVTASSLNDSASAYGIRAYSMHEGSILSNSGSITAGAQGTYWVGAYGISVNGLYGGAGLSNSGSIEVSAAVGGSGTGSAYGIYVSFLEAGSPLSNSGTITATGGTGVDFFGIRVAGGSGDLANSGSIFGGVSLGGTVSLSNSGNITLAAGQLSEVGGDYTQASSGQLTTVVRDAGTYGQLSVTGTADLSASGTLVLELDPELELDDGDVLHDVVSAGTLAAPASYDIVDPSLFWEFANVGNATTIDLEATRVTAASVLAGSGAVFTASQLALVDEMVGGGAGSAYSALVGALNSAPTAAAAAALVAQLSPAIDGAAGRAALAASDGIGALVDTRRSETGAASGDAAAIHGVWLKAVLGTAEQEAVSGFNGFDADTTGFVLGLDSAVSDSWRVGVAVASAQTDVDALYSALDIETLQFTVYGSYALGETASLDLDVGQVVNSIDSRRNVVFAGSTAVASYDGSQLALGAGLKNRASVGEHVALLPGVSMRYRQVRLDGYSETGAGAYDLTVDSRSDSALLWQAKLGLEVALGGYGTLLGNAAVGYDTLDAASATATLAGNGPTFISQGVKPESTVLNAGLGYRYVTAKGLEINALYELEDRDTFTADAASLKLRMPF